MDKSWPLQNPAPAAPPAAPEPAARSRRSRRESRRRRAAIRHANEDYHDFIEAVGKQQPRSDNVPRQHQQMTRLPVGTTRLQDHGRLRLLPAPSDNPRDPLNLPTWRKWAAVAAMTASSGLALAAEPALGSLLRPVFLSVYAGVDAASVDDDLALLANLPLLTTAAAAYVFVPLSAAVGRRPVLLLAGACAWAGALWAGLTSGSSSLRQHMAARALIGVGAGTASSVVPLVAAHDLFFLHQRHAVLAAVFAGQAVLVGAVTALAPYVAAVRSWRAVYAGLAAAGGVAWLAAVALVPETRWPVRPAVTPVAYVDARHRRPLDYAYGGRTLWTDLGFPGSGGGGRHLLASVAALGRTLFLPPVLWAVLLSSVLLAAQQATAEMAVRRMRAQGAPAAQTGLAAGASLAAAGLLAGLLGPLAGRASLAFTRISQPKRKTAAAAAATTTREAEHSLPLLVLPLALALAGLFSFAAAAQAARPWWTLVVASGLVALALVLSLAVVAAFLVESFPPLWAGPCLAHAGSLRFVVAYVVAGRTAALARRRGPLHALAIHAEVLVVASLGLPLLFFSGRRLRTWAAGTVAVVEAEVANPVFASPAPSVAVSDPTWSPPPPVYRESAYAGRAY